MPREYRHIKEYEKEILEIRKQGLTLNEIGVKLGFSKKQLQNFIARYNKAQKKHETGIALRKKGRPAKDSKITEVDKVSELKYLLARKETRIKSLEMENELMRDFLLHTERK